MRPFTVAVVIASSLIPVATSLQTVSGSNCSSVCTSGGASDTLPNDVVCNDSEFTSTTNGTRFRECVECELQSSAVDTSADSMTGDTDVNWGLYNLRYALSTCVYGIPVEKASMSTPCQVSCQPLENALAAGFDGSTTSQALDYCSNANFSSTAVYKCADCYNLTSTMRLMGNFLDTLYLGCIDQLAAGSTFTFDVDAVFSTESSVPTSVAASTGSTGSSSNSSKHLLPVYIAVPIIAVLLFACCGGGACFICMKRRRNNPSNSDKAARWQVRAAAGASPLTNPSSPFAQASPWHQPTSPVHPSSPHVGYTSAPASAHPDNMSPVSIHRPELSLNTAMVSQGGPFFSTPDPRVPYYYPTPTSASAGAHSATSAWSPTANLAFPHHYSVQQPAYPAPVYHPQSAVSYQSPESLIHFSPPSQEVPQFLHQQQQTSPATAGNLGIATSGLPFRDYKEKDPEVVANQSPRGFSSAWRERRNSSVQATPEKSDTFGASPDDVELEERKRRE